MIKKVK